MSRLAGTHLVTRLAAATVGVAAIMLASACGAGQIAETAKIKPAVPGGSGVSTVPLNPADKNSQPGQVFVENATFNYSDPAGYAKGSTAPLNMRIINGSGSDIALTGVTAMLNGATLGMVTIGGAGAAPSAAPISPAPNASASGSATPVPSASGSATPVPSASASPTATPQPAAPAKINIKIPAAELIDLSTAGQQWLEVTGLTQDLKPGYGVTITLSFTDLTNPKATINIITVIAPIGSPTAPATRNTASMSTSG